MGPVGWGLVQVRGPLRAGVTVFVFVVDGRCGGGGGLGLGVILEDAAEVEVPLYFRVFFSSVDGAVGYLGICGAQS